MTGIGRRIAAGRRKRRLESAPKSCSTRAKGQGHWDKAPIRRIYPQFLMLISICPRERFLPCAASKVHLQGLELRCIKAWLTSDGVEGVTGLSFRKPGTSIWPSAFQHGLPRCKPSQFTNRTNLASLGVQTALRRPPSTTGAVRRSSTSCGLPFAQPMR